MGCTASKNKIHVVQAARAESPTKRAHLDGDAQRWSSTGSLGADEASQRGFSATSKQSSHSGDSGFSDEYATVITEDSVAELVQQVEEEFDAPSDLDLGLDGTGCQQRRSAKDRSRAEEARVMAVLRSEGLIQRPVSRAAFGLSYDIISEETGFLTEKRPPARLAKLERRKKRRRQLTEDDIKQKLQKANERRKELEQERLAKIQAVTNISDVNGSADVSAQHLLCLDQHQKTKEEIAIENRQRRLEEMQRKLRAKQEHAELVRQRKKLIISDGDNNAPGGLTAAET